jgi:NADH-quinone oxidoreductase subunit L
VTIAYLIFLSHQLKVDMFTSSSFMQKLQRFWFSGWGIDWLYDRLFVKPYYSLARLLKLEPIDRLYGFIVMINQVSSRWLSAGQSGQMRRYITSMVFGLIVMLAILAGAF